MHVAGIILHVKLVLLGHAISNTETYKVHVAGIILHVKLVLLGHAIRADWVSMECFIN